MNRYSFRPLVKTLKEIAIPSVEQAVLSIVLSLAIIAVSFFSYFIKLVTGGDPATNQLLNETVSSYVSKLNDTPISEHIGSILIWGVVGAIAYIGLITVVNLVITARNIRIEARGGVTSVKQDSFSLLDEYRRAVWIVIAVVLCLISLFVLLGVWMDVFKQGIIDHNILQLAFGPLGLAINIYFVYMFVWVAWRNPSALSRI